MIKKIEQYVKLTFITKVNEYIYRVSPKEYIIKERVLRVKFIAQRESYCFFAIFRNFVFDGSTRFLTIFG